MKTTLMLAALAAVFAVGIACSGFSSKSASSSCEGLTGQAKIDCEKQHQQP